jgi:hypothetical protein
VGVRRLYQVDVPEDKWDAFEAALEKLGINMFDVQGEEEFDDQ